MTTTLKEMMDAANAAVPRITPAHARDMIAQGNTLIVDVRDALEVEKSGKIAWGGECVARFAGISRRPGLAVARSEFYQE
jgi:rhodanese-related sulfurtransferase